MIVKKCNYKKNLQKISSESENMCHEKHNKNIISLICYGARTTSAQQQYISIENAATKVMNCSQKCNGLLEGIYLHYFLHSLLLLANHFLKLS